MAKTKILSREEIVAEQVKCFAKFKKLLHKEFPKAIFTSLGERSDHALHRISFYEYRCGICYVYLEPEGARLIYEHDSIHTAVEFKLTDAEEMAATMKCLITVLSEKAEKIQELDMQIDALQCEMRAFIENKAGIFR